MTFFLYFQARVSMFSGGFSCQNSIGSASTFLSRLGPTPSPMTRSRVNSGVGSPFPDVDRGNNNSVDSSGSNQV